MAYVKRGKAREVHKGVWVALAVALVLAVTAGILGGTWAKNPRKFLQWFLSDQDYASYVLMHNVQDNADTLRPYLTRLSENSAYESTGNVSVELSADMKATIGDEDIEKTALRYLDRLTFTSNTQVRSLHFSNEMKLADHKQTIMTHDFAFLQDGGYSMVPQYGYGWTKVLGADQEKLTEEELARQRRISAILSSDNETVRDALAGAAKTGYKEVKKDLDVQVDEDITFDFQDKHVTGDRVNIVLSRADVLHFLNAFFTDLKDQKNLLESMNESLDTEDRFNSETELSAFVGDLQKYYETQIKETGVTDLSIDLCVDQQNVIHAFDALVKRADGDIIVNAMLHDEENRGPAFHLRMGGENVVKFNVEKSSDSSGTIQFAFGNFENSVTYSNLSTADGLVYGVFEFEPTPVSWSSDLGNFGLYIETSPLGASTEADGAVGNSAFHLTVRTGFSTLGTATVEADVQDAKYTGMVTEDDIVIHEEYEASEKAARRLQYWLVDLPQQDSLYSNALSKIINTIVNDVVSDLSSAAAAKKSDDANATLNAGA